jgi:hypothetical protein
MRHTTRWLATLAVTIIAASGLAAGPAAAATVTPVDGLTLTTTDQALQPSCANYAFTYAVTPPPGAWWDIIWTVRNPLGFTAGIHSTTTVSNLPSYGSAPVAGVQYMYLCEHLDGPGVYTLSGLFSKDVNNIAAAPFSTTFTLTAPVVVPPVVTPPVVTPPVVTPPVVTPPAPAPVVRRLVGMAVTPHGKLPRGHAATLTAMVTQGGAPVRNAVVSFQSRTLGRPWHTLAVRNTGNSNVVAYRVRPRVATSYRCSTASPGASMAYSSVVTVRVR